MNYFLTHDLLTWFKHFYPGSAELVFVSHVIDPCHFYIRKYSQIKDAKVLEKKVNEFCNRSSHLDPSDILELGNEILVQVKISNLFKYYNNLANPHKTCYNIDFYS